MNELDSIVIFMVGMFVLLLLGRGLVMMMYMVLGVRASLQLGKMMLCKSLGGPVNPLLGRILVKMLFVLFGKGKVVMLFVLGVFTNLQQGRYQVKMLLLLLLGKGLQMMLYFVLGVKKGLQLGRNLGTMLYTNLLFGRDLDPDEFVPVGMMKGGRSTSPSPPKMHSGMKLSMLFMSVGV